MGASHARFEALGARHHPVDQNEVERYESVVRNQLGEQAFREAWQVGQALALHEAVVLALTEIDSAA